MQKALFPKQVYFSCVRKSLKKTHSSEQHQVQMYIASAQIYGFQTAIDMKTRQKWPNLGKKYLFRESPIFDMEVDPGSHFHLGTCQMSRSIKNKQILQTFRLSAS